MKSLLFPQAVVLFLLLAGSELASAQTNARDEQYSYGSGLSPAMAVAIVIVVAILFFMGFFTVYLRRYTGTVDGSSSANPTVVGARRVAVARGLDASLIETFPTLVYSEQSVVSEPAVDLGGSVATRVKLSRSHTTGHSVVSPGECTERFTLRLPEDLRRKIMANWKMNRSNSVLVLPRGGSSRSGKPVDRSRARSDRWLFRKTQSFMWRSRDDGSIRLGGTGSIRANAITSPTGDSVRADRWNFLRNPSFLWRTTPVPSPRVEVNKDGIGTSSVQNTVTVV
ncbi:RING-type domain-containing protein [Raphanus sativus]|nr:RING-type domain-containing protein [Raphanus sativus]